MLIFLKYYILNLYRSKEKSIPLGFHIFGKYGFYLFRIIPFEFATIILLSFVLQWFCFGLTSEILLENNIISKGFLLPTFGFITSLFIFDFIHFNKSLYYNFKYINILNVSEIKKLYLNNLNELLGGKIFIIIIFLFFYLYYNVFFFFQILIVLSVYILYNLIIVMFSKHLLRYDWVKYLFFFILQISFILFYGSNEKNMQVVFLNRETFFFDNSEKLALLILVITMSLFLSQFLLPKKYK